LQLNYTINKFNCTINCNLIALFSDNYNAIFNKNTKSEKHKIIKIISISNDKNLKSKFTKSSSIMYKFFDDDDYEEIRIRIDQNFYS